MALTKEQLAAYRLQIGAAPMDVVPNPGPQTRFLACGAHEVLYGGMAGGGKTIGLLLSAVRRATLTGYRGLLLRREWPQVKRALLPTSKEIYPLLGGRWFAGAKIWEFPGGGTVELGSAPHEDDIERYQGTGLCFLGFDEATHFTRRQYTWMFGRMRSEGIPIRVRATTNPGSEGHEFVMQRFAPWIYRPGDPGYEGPYAEDGEILWFAPAGDDSDDEVITGPSDPDAISRTFIRSSYEDTPQIADQYRRAIAQMSRLDRKRLGKGDWHARDAKGEYFERGWFPIVEGYPPQSEVIWRVRYWDLAGTDERDAKPRSAWTSGMRLSITKHREVFIEHVARGHWGPGEVMRQVSTYGDQDRAFDPKTEVIIERDPGQAGKQQAWLYATEYRDLGIRAVAPSTDKLSRARLVSPQAEARSIKVVRGAWNEPLLIELGDFPEGTKDQVDCLSGGIPQLARQARRILGLRGEEPKRIVVPTGPVVRPTAHQIAREMRGARPRLR